jgi:hypothetical protein
MHLGDECYPVDENGKLKTVVVRAPRRDLKAKMKGLPELGIWKAAREKGPGRKPKGRDNEMPPPCPEIGLGVGPDYPEITGMALLPPIEWGDDDLCFEPGYGLDEDSVLFDGKDLNLGSRDFEFCQFD